MFKQRRGGSNNHSGESTKDILLRSNILVRLERPLKIPYPIQSFFTTYTGVVLI